MTAAFFLLLIASGGGVSTTPFASRDFCVGALDAVMKLDSRQRGVCVSSGAIERAGDEAEARVR